MGMNTPDWPTRPRTDKQPGRHEGTRLSVVGVVNRAA